MVPEWIEEAIVDAKRRGMEAFVVILPIEPNLLREKSEIDPYIGAWARDEMLKQISKWRAEDNANTH